MWLDKPWEFWVALIAAAAYVYERGHEKKITSRILLVISSTGLGASLSEDLAEWSGHSEILAVVVITTTGYLVLDVITSLIRDREFVKELIRKRLGGSNNE
ncbi:MULTISPECIES: hypothetical protein [unclassified Roseobacter]|uniref:hypothetical protein n=1 Tax=unclassified Roseobacter TaxID=196798 RepID=UPI001492AFF1|nr:MULTISPECIES: hypothetical protein [unclassified Roseobacter]NNW55498.1 hypothetical protein [Roseobacter sp. HKCCD8284]NNY17315.1 hypothetical protein [Roseobacter sp. HKCCD8191]